jgi:hypothetical protein
LSIADLAQILNRQTPQYNRQSQSQIRNLNPKSAIKKSAINNPQSAIDMTG